MIAAFVLASFEIELQIVVTVTGNDKFDFPISALLTNILSLNLKFIITTTYFHFASLESTHSL